MKSILRTLNDIEDLKRYYNENMEVLTKKLQKQMLNEKTVVYYIRIYDLSTDYERYFSCEEDADEYIKKYSGYDTNTSIFKSMKKGAKIIGECELQEILSIGTQKAVNINRT
jgi:hypothetical protein